MMVGAHPGTLPPRWGEGWVGGEPAGFAENGEGGASPDRFREGADTPPSPTLPPSRGKGAFAHPAHASGAVGRARRLRREQTVAERLLWAELRALKMNFRRQAPVGRYVVDFVHVGAKLVLEVDGPHHETPEQSVRDAARDSWLESQGFRVLRVKERVVRERLSEVTERLAAIVRADRAPPPSQPFPHQGGRALWRARHQWERES